MKKIKSKFSRSKTLEHDNPKTSKLHLSKQFQRSQTSETLLKTVTNLFHENCDDACVCENFESTQLLHKEKIAKQHKRNGGSRSILNIELKSSVKSHSRRVQDSDSVFLAKTKLHVKTK